MACFPMARVAGLLLLAAATTACATASNPWDVQGLATADRADDARYTRSTVCPVVLTNGTDEQLDAGYLVDGIESVLGVIPAGRSLSFGVECDSDRIEAFGVAPALFLGDGPEYRTVASLDRGKPTHMGFTVVDRVR